MSKEKRFVIQVDPLEIEDDAIYDNKELRLYECQSDMMSDICSLLNKQENRIAELEEQLRNAIVPKFKIGDKVYGIIDTFAYTDVLPIEIRDTHLLYEVWDGQDTTKQHHTRIFATKEEAQAKLRELQGENND